ncbi:delta-endotoxin CytB, partial [Marasmius fiardii PR-910]
GDDLRADGFSNTRIYQDGQTIEAFVKKIVDFLGVALAVNLTPEDIARLVEHIERILTNLEVAKENNWAHFNNTGASPSWMYQIRFAFPYPDLPDYFYSLVTTIKFQANSVRDETWWFQLTKETKGNVSADVDAMRLMVKKGFMDPIS